MKYLCFLLSQITIFFGVAIGLSMILPDPVRPGENVAIAAAYGSLFILPITLSIIKKDWHFLGILGLILCAYIDSRMSGTSIANPPIIYACIWGVGLMFARYLVAWLSFATGIYCLFLVLVFGGNMTPGENDTYQLIANLLFMSLLTVPFFRLFKDHAPKAKDSVYIAEYKKAA